MGHGHRNQQCACALINTVFYCHAIHKTVVRATTISAVPLCSKCHDDRELRKAEKMAIDLSSLFWIFIAIMVLQPLLTGRWYALRRAQAIRAIERSHGSRVITMIHRQEKRSIFGFAVSRHIDLEGAQAIIAAIKDTPDDMPINLVLHTPGGLVLAAMQIARAVEAHKAKVTVYVPVYAMSGGTLIALAANEIMLGEFSVLGPIDPQIAGFPAASIVKARD